MRTFHIYITADQISNAVNKHPGEKGYRSYVAERFTLEHQLMVLDFEKLRYYQNKNNKTGDTVIEVEAPASAVGAI